MLDYGWLHLFVPRTNYGLDEQEYKELEQVNELKEIDCDDLEDL